MSYSFEMVLVGAILLSAMMVCGLVMRVRRKADIDDDPYTYDANK